MSMQTITVLMVSQGKKLPAWILAFSKSLIFVIAIRAVLLGLDDWQKLIGYAAGFATGLVVGMAIEERVAMGYTHLRVISKKRGEMLADILRDEGYAVTDVAARGMEGTGSLLNLNVRRKQAPAAVQLISKTDPEAFITAEAVRAVQKGFWKNR